MQKSPQGVVFITPIIPTFDLLKYKYEEDKNRKRGY